MKVDQIRVEDGMFQKCTVNKLLSLQTLIMHLSIKLRGVLRPKSVRRTLIMGLVYGREQISSLT